MHENPFLAEYSTPYEIPPFEEISYDDYLPALEEGISRHNAEIKAITDNDSTPTFDNTILALDRTGDVLDRVVLVFAALEESNSSPEMMEIAEKFYPAYQAHADEMMMNDKLFERVKYLYDRRDSLGLASDQLLAVEKMYKDFTRNGALLSPADKETLKGINAELADLYLQFNRNLLNATNSFAVTVDNEADLAGLQAQWLWQRKKQPSAAWKANGCSRSMLPAACPYCSLPRTATFAAVSTKGIPPRPLKATTTIFL